VPTFVAIGKADEWSPLLSKTNVTIAVVTITLHVAVQKPELRFCARFIRVNDGHIRFVLFPWWSAYPSKAEAYLRII